MEPTDLVAAASQQVPSFPAPPPPGPETAGMVLAAQAKALVEARYTIAIRQPRDLDSVRERLLKECRRPAFAVLAIYNKPIGKGVEGPSIRFAEAALQAMTNITVDTPTIYDDDDKRIMRVSVADMETNLAFSQDVTVAKRVERRRLKEGDVAIRSRTNSTGQTVYLVAATDEEILNLQNALVSKAIRTVGLRLVPGWLIEEALDTVRMTRASHLAKDPDEQRRKLFDSFLVLGVNAESLKAYLGHDGERLAPKEREELVGIYTAIRDGDTTWREVMEAREPPKSPSDPRVNDPGTAPAAPPKGAAAAREQMAKHGTPPADPAP